MASHAEPTVSAAEALERLKAGKVCDTPAPVTTVVITDQPVVRNRNTKPFFES